MHKPTKIVPSLISPLLGVMSTEATKALSPRRVHDVEPGLGEHLDLDAARDYVFEVDDAVYRWADHLGRCVACRSLIAVLRGPETPPRFVHVDRFTWDAVTYIVNWPLDRWRLLSSDNIDAPELAGLVASVEALFDRAWTARGLPCECSLAERVRRDDVVIVALADDETAAGVIFGRLSHYEHPLVCELGCSPKSVPRTLNVYAVVVDERHRGEAMAVKLMLMASSYVIGRAPGVRIRTISPALGFRGYIGALLEEVAGRASVDDLIADTYLGDGGFEKLVGVDARTWLRALHDGPRAMLAEREQANDHARAAMDALVERLADHYALELCNASTERDVNATLDLPASYLCRLHEMGGCELDGTQAFSNLDDPENLFVTISYCCNPVAEYLRRSN